MTKELEKDKKEVNNRKIDCGDAVCPDLKRRPGRPRKTAVEAKHAAISSSTIEREKPPNQQSNELASVGAPTFATPDNVKPEPLTSTLRITNITMPRTLWIVKASTARVGDLKKHLRWENDVKTDEEIQKDNAKVYCGNELEVGEYVVVLSQETEVPGRITKCLRNGKSTIFLVRASTRPRGWKWPDKTQISSIFKHDVRKRLDSPALTMSHGNDIVFSFEVV